MSRYQSLNFSLPPRDEIWPPGIKFTLGWEAAESAVEW
jgi:hypothetical protein